MRYLFIVMLLAGCASQESYKYRTNADLCLMAVNGLTNSIQTYARQELDNRGENCANVQRTQIYVPPQTVNRAPVTCQTQQGAAVSTTTCR